MIRYIRFALLAVLAIVVLTLALANRAPVAVNLLTPDLAALFGVNWTLQVPMFLVIFASIILGLLIGFVWEWLREYKHRRVAGVKTRQVTKLERELAMMQDASTLPKDDILAILDTSK